MPHLNASASFISANADDGADEDKRLCKFRKLRTSSEKLESLCVLGEGVGRLVGETCEAEMTLNA